MKGVPSERRKAARPDDPELRGRRSERRAYLVLPASAEAISGHLSVTLMDVGGFALARRGQGHHSTVRRTDTFGTIAWAASRRCGMQFDEPIGVEDLRALRALSNAAKRSDLTPDERQAAADWANGLAR